jgi:hypothetical protein
MDDLDHLLLEHHQTLEVHYQNLLPLVPEQEFVLQVLVEVSKSVAVVELLVKE